MSLTKKIHFIHANGFPPKSYKSLFNSLDDNLDIKYFSLIDLKYLKINNWNIFKSDFIKSLDINEKTIGMGHSIGGNIILRSAINNPKYFSKIVLLDPTLFIPRIILMWKLAIYLKIHDFLHPWVKATLRRKMNYKDIESIYQSYRNKDVFSKINDENLYQYIDALTKKNNKGLIEIIYPKELEYQIYKTGLLADNYIWENIKYLKVPALIIRSNSSNAFYKSAAKKVKKLNKNIKIIELDNCTHLFPLEIPDSTSKHIIKFINN